MVHPRVLFDAALLTNGTILVVGDDGCGLMAGAEPGSELTEVFDPSTDTWTEVSSLNKPRGHAELVRLPDGTAMVLGGVNEQDLEFSSTKIYSSSDRSWSNGPLQIAAGSPVAVALGDGTIISVGRDRTEILDSGATDWRRSTAPPKVFLERLILLADGQVMGVGDNDNEERDAAFVLFDPRTEHWKRIAVAESSRSPIIPLDDGSALAIGTNDSNTRVERYYRAHDRWVAMTPLRAGRMSPQVTRLEDGRVLVAGGTTDGVTPLDSTEIYDPVADAWTDGPTLLQPRQGGWAISLPDGSALVFGGEGKAPDDGSGDTGSCVIAPIAESERWHAVP